MKTCQYNINTDAEVRSAKDLISLLRTCNFTAKSNSHDFLVKVRIELQFALDTTHTKPAKATKP